MRWDDIVTAVREMIENSELEMQNVDWQEVGKYLAVMMTEEEITAEGLRHVVPRRREGVRRLRRITIRYLHQKKNSTKWLPARRPGVRQQRRMLALAISFGVKMVMSNHTYKLGDRIYLQAQGGPIGLELTGAVSRPFMMRWDKMYLKKVKKAGLDMKIYKRYADDSNQVVVLPPPGSRYDVNSNKVVQDGAVDEAETEELRLTRILKQIADSVQVGIVMEADHPENNVDKKMPILDMKVWLGEEGFLLHKHYEKQMSSKLVLHANSAQSSGCKRNVHRQELIRRMLNCSVRLDWQHQVAPILTEYMARMRDGGYSQGYRRNVLQHALAVYDKMRKEDEDGTTPLNRPSSWQLDERRKRKKKRRHEWSTKGGHIAPIFVPPTPNSELAAQLRRIAEQEAEAGINFLIVESGGRSVKSVVQSSNPTATRGCEDSDCLPCQTGGHNCQQSNICYEVECQLCPDGRKSLYIGESSRNLFTRAKEHLANYRNDRPKSFMKKHQNKKHGGLPGSYQARVTGSYTDCLSRQVMEGVCIRRCQVDVLNGKSEWHQPPLWQVQNELYRG